MVDLMSRWPIQLCNVRIDAVPQMLCCESVAELVEEEMPAIRSLCAFVPVFGHTLSAVQFGALGHALDDHVIFTVGIAS